MQLFFVSLKSDINQSHLPSRMSVIFFLIILLGWEKKQAIKVAISYA